MHGRSNLQFFHPGEKTAWEHLHKLGHILLCHNFRTIEGEIDLITKDASDVIHFYEVKSWNCDEAFHPIQIFNYKKKNTMRKLAYLYFLENDLDAVTISFGLIWIQKEKIEVFDDVF